MRKDKPKRKSGYAKHQEALKFVAELFNKTSDGNVIFVPHKRSPLREKQIKKLKAIKKKYREKK